MRLRIALAIGLCVLAGTAPAEEPRVQASYVAWAPADGGPAFVGVRLEMAPGWHVYWRHPGPAGLATEVEVEAPPSLEVGELLWPVPEGFIQPGEIPAYGYEEDVVLVREVAGDAVRSGGTVTVDASWLACEDVCVLGGATVSGTAPRPGERTGVAAKEVAAWRASLPGPLDESAPFRASVTGSIDEGLVVWLQWSSEPGPVELFPAPGDGVRVDGVTSRTRGGLTRIDIATTALREKPQDLQAVVAADASDGARRGWTLRAGRRMAVPTPHDSESEHGGTR